MIVSLINKISSEERWTNIIKDFSKMILANNSPFIVYRYAYGEDSTELFQHITDTEEVISFIKSEEDKVYLYVEESHLEDEKYQNTLSLISNVSSDNVELKAIDPNNPMSDNAYNGPREKFNICMEVALPENFDRATLTLIAGMIKTYGIDHFDTYSKVGEIEYDSGFMKSPKGWWYRTTVHNTKYPLTSYYKKNCVIRSGIGKDKSKHKFYFLDENGHCVSEGWHTIKGTDLTYYTNDESEVLGGWNNIEGSWYYFNENVEVGFGKMLDDIVQINGKDYIIRKGKLVCNDPSKFALDENNNIKEIE